MKRPIILLAAALTLTAAASAQEWKEALKKAATTAVDKATDGKLTQYALVGQWNYTGPGIRFEGGDVTSELSGAALGSSVKGYLEKAYQLAGIRPGASAFSFDREGNFTATFGKRELTGTYSFDPATHLITLRFSKGKYNLGSVPGHAYISGEELQMLFPVTKLVEMVTALGSRVSSLQAVTRLLKQYENAYIGFEYGKQPAAEAAN